MGEAGGKECTPPPSGTTQTHLPTHLPRVQALPHWPNVLSVGRKEGTGAGGAANGGGVAAAAAAVRGCDGAEGD